MMTKKNPDSFTSDEEAIKTLCDRAEDAFGKLMKQYQGTISLAIRHAIRDGKPAWEEAEKTCHTILRRTSVYRRAGCAQKNIIYGVRYGVKRRKVKPNDDNY